MSISLLLPVVLLALAPQDKPFVHPQGRYPTVHPRARDVLRDDFRVHQDTTGGGRQELLALAGGPEGAVAVWQDQRHGNLGLYMGYLGASGEPVGRDLPLNPPRTSRQMRPAVAIGPDRHAAAAWHYTDPARRQVFLRFRKAGVGFLGGPEPIGTPGGRTGVRGKESDQPALALGADGDGWLAWIESERVHARRLLKGGKSERDLGSIDESAPPALGDLQLAIAPSGRAALAWRAEKGAVFCLLDSVGRARSSLLGAGVPLDLVPAESGGWWLLLRRDSGLALLELTAEGAPAREVLRPVTGPFASAEFSTWSGGLALAVERGRPAVGRAGGGGGDLELHLLDASGAARFGVLALTDAAAVNARGPHVVELGPGELLLAWTDDRAGNPDVWYRLLRPDPGAGSVPDAGAARRWNQDEGSSDQQSPDVDAREERALIAWQDQRSGEPRIWARRLDDQGQFDGDEFELSAGTASGSEAWRPAVSLARDGSFLAVWKLREPGRPGAALVGRLFGPGRKALGPTLVLDEGHTGSSAWACAVAADPDRGWLLVWVRVGEGVFARRVGIDAALGAVHQLGRSDGASAGNPALTALTGTAAANRAAGVAGADRAEGYVAVWDLKPEGDQKSMLRGRLFGEDGTPRGERELDFPPSPLGGDLDPALAPAPEGGFLLTWTGNDGRPRDVFARLFRPAGEPLGPLLPISVKGNEQDFSDVVQLPDGSWVVAWEDDISGKDHCLARRIAPDARSLGAVVTLNQRKTLYVETRTAPRLATHGEGFLAAWGDRRRSLGHDVYAALFGSRFDSAREGRRGAGGKRAEDDGSR